MKYYLRVLGWLLLGMGSVLAVLGLSSVIGLMEIPIDFWFFTCLRPYRLTDELETGLV